MKTITHDETKQVAGGEVTGTTPIDIGIVAPYPYDPYPSFPGGPVGPGVNTDRLMLDQAF